MSDYTAIADAGKTLIELLKEKIRDLVPGDSIVLLSPGEIGNMDNIRLSLFLYRIAQNTRLNSRETGNVSPSGYSGPSSPELTLDLYYMLSSHPNYLIQDRTERSLEEQRVLGRAMQVFHEHPLLAGSMLKGSLSSAGNEIKVMSAAQNLEDAIGIWKTFGEKIFRPSVCYVVSPIRIGLSHERQENIVVRTADSYRQISEIRKK